MPSPHATWPVIRARTHPVELVFPKHSKNNMNRILKFNRPTLWFLDARKFTSKAFRRGATQELLTTGNSLEVVKNSWGCRGPGFSSYVDIAMDKAFRIARLLVTLSDDSSDEELPNAKTKRAKKNATTKPVKNGAKTIPGR